jgi:Xaa-Pro aminopeptidase
VDQEESILLLFPDAPYEHRNIISKETNDHIAVWKVKNKERALAVTGIKTVYWLQDFEGIIRNDDSCGYLHQYE